MAIKKSGLPKAKDGIIDKDLGLEDIFKEMNALKEMTVKVGIPEDASADGLHIAQYAAWNELGVMKKDGSGWYIPPRPFMRTTADSKREKIQKAIDASIGLIQHGKTDAKTALGRVGEAFIGLIKETIKSGPWDKNSYITIHGTPKGKNGKQFIKRKKSTKPLIDTGAMKNSIQYITERNGAEIDRGK